MQQRAIILMARKMAAAMAIDGELNVEGLSAMSDDGSAAMQLARSLSEKMDDKEIGRNWAKVKSRTEVQPIDPAWTKLAAELIDETPLDDIDTLDMEPALLAQTLLGKDFDLSKDTLARMAAELFDDDLMLVDV
jgi:hypothetical protein